MLNIIRSEFYKVRKSRITFVTALILLGIAGIQLAAYLVAAIAGGIWSEIMSSILGIDVYATFSTGTFYLVFVALFVGGMVTNEYTFSTVRQMVSRGVSRVHIALGQYIALSTTMTIITVIPAAICAIAATMYNEFGNISPERFVLVLLGQIIVIWSYSALSMLIGHITRSGGLAIGINIIILLGGGIATLVLDTLTKKDFFSTYWLTNVQQEALDVYISAAQQGKFISILFVFGVVCTALGVLCFQKRDIN